MFDNLTRLKLRTTCRRKFQNIKSDLLNDFILDNVYYDTSITSISPPKNKIKKLNGFV